jgi:hypothetical protein
MSFFKHETAGLDKAREVEVEIRELVRRDICGLGPNPGAESDLVANDIGSLLKQVAGSSVQEIEWLIAELKGLREKLSTECERVQREIVQYAALNQAATQSTKTLAESISRWSCGRVKIRAM